MKLVEIVERRSVVFLMCAHNVSFFFIHDGNDDGGDNMAITEAEREYREF